MSKREVTPSEGGQPDNRTQDLIHRITQATNQSHALTQQLQRILEHLTRDTPEENHP